jgi:hypothetical protein
MHAKVGSFKLAQAAIGSGSFELQSEAPIAAGYRVTDAAILPVVVPRNFVAGSQALTVNISAGVVSSSPGQSLVSGANCSLSVLRLNNDGTVTDIPVTTGAQALPAASWAFKPGYSQLVFMVDGTELNPGDQLLLCVQVQFGESGPVKTYVSIALAQAVFSVQNYQAD